MMNPAFLLSHLSGFSGNRVTITRNQDVYDIIGAMLEAHKIHAKDYDKIANYFWAGSEEKTAKNIFDFLKKNVRYSVESDANQRVMSPAAILTLRANDCKNYSLFIAGILDALKRQGKIKSKILYRFASYRLLDEMPHHVFVVLQKKDREIWIDPVLSSFDNRKIYFHKIDREPMALYSVSGIGQTRKQARQKKRAEKKASKAAPVVPGQPAPKKRKIVLQIALSPARTAFLLLVGANFAGIATKLKAAVTKAADKTANWWSTLGGNPNKLLKTIDQGARKRRILGDQVGEPVTAATAGATAAVAAPILVKLAEFLKGLGIDPEEVGRAGKKLLANKVREVVNKEVEKSERRAAERNEQFEEIVSSGNQNIITEKKGLPWLPIALGAGVIFLATRKK